MIEAWIGSVKEGNLITLILMVIILISLLQGFVRGASRSAGTLVNLITEGVFTIVGIAGAFLLSLKLSPTVQAWLSGYSEAMPSRDLNTWEQIYYTVLTALADFPLLRFAVLFVISYSIIRFILSLIGGFFRGTSTGEARNNPGFLSRLMGACFGAVVGAARCVLVIALLFIVVSLYPGSSFSNYVESSPMYQQGAKSVIEPISGNLIKDKLPVISQAAQKEFNGMMQRRYEVIDRNIPEDIEGAAAKIVEGAATDEQKARELYEWVGTRVEYDYGKVEDYEQRGIWNEQTPQDTFDTMMGVCIDYARLYAVMARSQDLEVRVVTGLGYNGQGGYGAHAWNEVYLSEQDTWVPLDPTWANSGDWFNPPHFYDTHIKDQTV
ncbi:MULTISPECIES: transglutaminase domain-containing protein [unclassified Paenibacillus]|uniref:CvpA family protein n=1 Tax=Paenibacillus provencensis TaxID=441151 RepID=A0ABW3PXU0_9BACL|nr:MULTISPECIES: transglutaminase domain-containing protein [unclassified Paenibacillus]MCM3129784.1 transglutaminase domain-containing protein [Paenibacillus sp. MER 78]SFS92045.1 Colicin V production protein [Paenibacillus sp. 453mf]